MPKRKIVSLMKDAADVKSCTDFHSFTKKEIELFRRNLLEWYSQKKRDLPWRKMSSSPDVNKRAYAVWVSEVMLQQTQVATVVSYYNKWMKKWPTVQDLADADLEEVNEMWAGLGYYPRGRKLHEAAQKVVKELGGEVPRTAETLMKQLPGVGRYTAGAIASIAYNEVTGLVDGNVVRVLCRMRAIGADSTAQVVTDKLWDIANAIVDPDSPGDFNQGLMELGATVCQFKNPDCHSCPVSKLCLAFRKVENEKRESSKKLLKTNTDMNNSPVKDIEDCAVEQCRLCIPEDEQWNSSIGVMNYPRKGKKKAPREERTAVCIVQKSTSDGPKYLIVQRPNKGLLAGLWEFPSQVQTEEDKVVTTQQVLEEMDSLKHLDISSEKYVGEVVHIFSHIHQTYVVHSAVSKDEDVSLSEKPAMCWVTKEEFLAAGVSTAMKKVFKCFENGSKLKMSKDEKKKQDSRQPSLDRFFKPKT